MRRAVTSSPRQAMILTDFVSIPNTGGYRMPILILSASPYDITNKLVYFNGNAYLPFFWLFKSFNKFLCFIIPFHKMEAEKARSVEVVAAKKPLSRYSNSFYIHM